jgi:hypothetical protein
MADFHVGPVENLGWSFCLIAMRKIEGQNMATGASNRGSGHESLY